MIFTVCLLNGWGPGRADARSPNHLFARPRVPLWLSPTSYRGEFDPVISLSGKRSKLPLKDLQTDFGFPPIAVGQDRPRAFRFRGAPSFD